MRRVVVESPYRGDNYAELGMNLRYARALMRFCVLRGDTPYASHLLLTQEGVLDDRNPQERALGIGAAFPWAEVADLVVVGVDRRISEGMAESIRKHDAAGRIVELVRLPDWASWEEARA